MDRETDLSIWFRYRRAARPGWPGARAPADHQAGPSATSKLVDRDNPANSKLLLRPLSPLAGGDLVWEHSGGRQFESKDDPDWQAMAAWAGAGK